MPSQAAPNLSVSLSNLIAFELNIKPAIYIAVLPWSVQHLLYAYRSDQTLTTDHCSAHLKEWLAKQSCWLFVYSIESESSTFVCFLPLDCIIESQALIKISVLELGSWAASFWCLGNPWCCIAPWIRSQASAHIAHCTRWKADYRNSVWFIKEHFDSIYNFQIAQNTLWLVKFQ